MCDRRPKLDFMSWKWPRASERSSGSSPFGQAVLLLLLLVLVLLLPHPSTSQVPTNLSTSYSCCQPLGHNMQLWWRLPAAVSNNTNTPSSSATAAVLDFALVGTVSTGSWMAWGPAEPGAVNRLMGHADVVAAGIDETTSQPWAEDMFLSSYFPCDTSTSPPDGVCPDSAFSPASTGNVRLLAGSHASGVTTLLLSRPLAASDAFDHPINMSELSSYIWATGPLSSASPSANLTPAFRLSQHGSSPDAYGTLTSFSLSSCPAPSDCPSLATAPVPSAPSTESTHSVLLAGGGARVSWVFTPAGVNLTVQAMQRSGYAALGLGTQMAGARTYVAWEESGAMRVGAYDMASYSAGDIVAVSREAANITHAAQLDGVISFSLSLNLGSSSSLESGNPAPASIPLLWALGNSWSSPPTDGNQHFSRSAVATFVNLMTGAAAAGSPPPPPPELLAHALCMFIAFGMLVPALAFCARYLRAGSILPSSTAWFPAHWALAALAITLAMAGGLTSALLLQSRQRNTIAATSTHSQLGIAALALMCAQPLNALIRPKPQPPTFKRRAWQLLHRLSALAALACGLAALVTGLQESCTWGFAAPLCGNLQNGLTVWFSCLGAYVLVRELAAAVAAGDWLKQQGGGARATPSKPPQGQAAAAVGINVAEDDTELGDAAGRAPASRSTARTTEVNGFWAAVALLLVSILFSLLLAFGVLGGGAGTVQVQDSDALPAPTPQPSSAASQPTPSSSQSAPLQPPSQPSPAALQPAPPRPAVDLHNCSLTHSFELDRLGDGWCDALAPYNTAACGFDGGDCCNVDLPVFDCVDPSSPNAGRSAFKGLQFPAPLNPRYTSFGPGRQLSSSTLVQSYNNYYEFTSDKSVKQLVTTAATQQLDLSSPSFPPWTIVIDGLVSQPMTLDVRDLIKLFHVERRIYRHRCVETWALVVPWEGFPLRKLLAIVQPLPLAEFVRFESDHGQYYPQVVAHPNGVQGTTWPYVEGLTVEEAWNDLAFLSIGQYNATLPVQNGSPIRLTLPWKYGFKSIKAIRRISFTAQQPVNWWQAINPREYGFYANVNPKFPHPRWPQSKEGLLVSSSYPQATLPTLIYNGYESEVGHMYGSEKKYFY